MKQTNTIKFKRGKTNLLKSFLIFFGALSQLGIYAQTSYTFTAAGLTGPVGPTQTQLNTAYASTSLSGSVTVSGGIQTFTIPATGPYRITAIGAQGGYNGGMGASMAGTYTLTAGTVLKILVGQQGTQGTNGAPYSAGGGGGGSFVTSLSNVPYIVAGGGGGNGDGYLGYPVTCCLGGMEATTVTAANPYPSGGSNGGTGGNGGSCASYGAGGGAGINGDGPLCYAGVSALSFTNGGTGGTGFAYAGTVANGGFGGGGGDADSGTGMRGGGGGGYSGGGGGAANSNGNDAAGGGGGSYNSATTQTNAVNTTTGNGKVIIDLLCNIKITAAGGTNSVSPAMCSGNSLTLTTNAVSNFTWSNGNTTNTVIVVTPTSSQIYSIVGTNSTSCSAAGSISVTVNTLLPAITITNTPNNICLGKTATLTAGGAITYTWVGGPGGVVNGQSFFPTSTANYTVSGQNGCGTTTSVTTITVAPIVVTPAASPALSCSGYPATLTVTSPVTGYTWTPGPITGSNVIVVPTVTTVYTVAASDGTCFGVATITVTTKANPTISIVASTQTVCQGAAVTLTASGALTYTWTSPVSNSPNISDNPTTATLYQVSGTNSLNCTSSGSQLVFTQPSPTITIASNKSIVCSGDPVTLTASGATTYNWTNGPATAGNAVNPTSNTTYTVTGTATSCSSSKTITINVLAASVLASVTTPSICNGASTSLHASGATSYTWVGQIAFSPGNANVSPTVTTIYTVSALTTSAGLSCPSSTNITVTVFINPAVTIAATKSVVCKADANVVLTGGGATSYTWSSSSTPSANISVHPQSTTTYSVTGTDANGCMNTTSQVITVNACTGIAELKNNEKSISIYPNPSNGEFVVSSDSEITLRVINELGQEIRTIKLSEQNDYKVSVTNLANGVYFVVGQNSTDKISQKIIVTK